MAKLKEPPPYCKTEAERLACRYHTAIRVRSWAEDRLVMEVDAHFRLTGDAAGLIRALVEADRDVLNAKAALYTYVLKQPKEKTDAQPEATAENGL